MSTPTIPPSRFFAYRDGVLCAEDVSLESVADEMGTPAFVYSGAAIDANYAAIDGSLAGTDHLVAYAVKANGNLAILARLARSGCGADIVSGGELARVLKAGFSPNRIVFSGVGKTSDEIRAALSHGVRSIHAEGEHEIDRVEAIARELGSRAPLSLRVNPDVDAGTHPYIATGLETSKFGISIPDARRLVPRILNSNHLTLEGLSCHIGSMILTPEPIREAVEIIARFAREVTAAGARLRTLDAGGGWPIRYGDEDRETAEYADFGRAVIEGIRAGGADELGLCLVVEPGRSLVGDAGVLLTRVLHVKQQGRKRFVVVDASMTELIRPALYDAYHAIVPVTRPETADMITVDVVGPVCESGDFIARDRALPAVVAGDLVAVRGAGAYAAVMSSNYNARPHAIELLVDGSQTRVVRRRQEIEDLWRDEIP